MKGLVGIYQVFVNCVCIICMWCTDDIHITFELRLIQNALLDTMFSLSHCIDMLYSIYVGCCIVVCTMHYVRLIIFVKLKEHILTRKIYWFRKLPKRILEPLKVLLKAFKKQRIQIWQWKVLRMCLLPRAIPLLWQLLQYKPAVWYECTFLDSSFTLELLSRAIWPLHHPLLSY